MTPMITAETWPSLPLEAWSDTCATLHLWTQIVGKIRLALYSMDESLLARNFVRDADRPHHGVDSL